MKLKKNILITGGAGYVGTLLTNNLVKNGHKVTVIDTFWFGDYLVKNKNLKKIKLNILDKKIFTNKYLKKKFDIIYHLAGIANDNAAIINPKLSWEINCLGTKNICEFAKQRNIKRLVYASSGSVYGIKKEKKVHENLRLEPISDYNKTKMIAEDIVVSYRKFFDYLIVRPSTLFGYSPKMRLDLTINILTFSALKKKEINVFGGNQYRPFLHVQDMVRFYEFVILKNIKNMIINVSDGNLTVLQTAKIVSKLSGNTKIFIKQSNDIRSYRIDNSKMKKVGFKTKINLKGGIVELIKEIKSKKIKDKKNFHSINWLKNVI